MSEVTFRTVSAGVVTLLLEQLEYLKTCREFQGTPEAILEGAAGAFETPAVFLLFDGMAPYGGPEGESFDDRLYQAQFTALCVSRSLGGRLAAAEGEEHSAHAMVEDVLAVVPDQDLGLEGYEGLSPGAVRRVKAGPTEAAYLVELVGLVTLEKPGAGGEQ